MQLDDIFQLLTASDRDDLFRGAPRKSLRRGDILFRENEEQPNLYILRHGHVRVERLYQDRGVAVARYGPGDVIGEISYIQKQPAHGTVVAEEDAEVDVLEGRHIDGLLTSNPGFAARFYHSLALCLGDRLLQIMPGIKLRDAFKVAGAGPLRTRTGQLSERQFPPELAARVEAFRSAMRILTAELDQGLDAARAQPRVNQACDDVIDTLNRFTQDDTLVAIGMDDPLAFRDVPDLARGVGGYIFRETFATFMQSATIAQGFERARGQAEGREFLERIERDDADGDGRLGPLIDRWFLRRPLCEARRASVRHAADLLQQSLAASSGSGPLRVTSLAAGTGAEIFALLAAAPPSVYVTCLAADADDLVIAADSARQHGCADRITFLQADLLDVAEEVGVISLGPQHVIYGLGVCDYLSDDQMKALLDWMHDQLSPGGWAILTNRDAASPDRALVEHILDWPAIHRSAEDFAGLFAQSKFASAPIEMGHEATGVTLFARCRKV